MFAGNYAIRAYPAFLCFYCYLVFVLEITSPAPKTTHIKGVGVAN